MSRHLSSAVGLVSTGLIGAGLVLTSLPAQAASPHRASTAPPVPRPSSVVTADRWRMSAPRHAQLRPTT